MALKGSKTENNLKEAFAGESQANRRYLYFAQNDLDAVDDLLCMPVSKFRGFVITTTDAVSLTMTFDRLFESLTRDTDNEDFDQVDLVITSGKHKQVIQAIADAIKNSRDPLINIADAINSEFVSSDVTGIASITIVR